MKYLYKNEYWSVNKDYYVDKLLYLMIDRPNYINCNSNFTWKNNREQWHRDYDLPSNVYYYKFELCDVFWYKNGSKHREKFKSTYIGYHGLRQYYINGNFIKEENLLE